MPKDRARPDDPQEIYRQLKRGLGHELVNDGNVFELIDLARLDGHQLLEQELREWQAPCGQTQAEGPRPTMAPTAGFNKENAKR
jgi:hypothetical protein